MNSILPQFATFDGKALTWVYDHASKAQLSDSIREVELNFTGHCIHVSTEKLANRFVIR